MNCSPGGTDAILFLVDWLGEEVDWSGKSNAVYRRSEILANISVRRSLWFFSRSLVRFSIEASIFDASDKLVSVAYCRDDRNLLEA